MLWVLDDKADVSVRSNSGVWDDPVWRDIIDVSRREPVSQNLVPKNVRAVLGGLVVINPYSGDVNDRLGVAITTKTENYRK